MKQKRTTLIQIRLNLLVQDIENLMDLVHPDSKEKAMLRAAYDLLEMFYERDAT